MPLLSSQLRAFNLLRFQFDAHHTKALTLKKNNNKSRHRVLFVFLFRSLFVVENFAKAQHKKRAFAL